MGNVYRKNALYYILKKKFSRAVLKQFYVLVPRENVHYDTEENTDKQRLELIR